MSWLRMEDDFVEDPDILALSSDAIVLHLSGLCYCARQETDGAVPGHALPILSRFSNPRTKRLIGELEKVGLWQENGTGWAIRNYLKYNPSHSSLEEKRKAKQRAGQAGGLAKAKQHGKERG